MTYTILLHPKVDKFLNTCEKELSERIKTKLRELKEDPFSFLERLEGHDFYKLRIGDYRALIDVDTKQYIIRVRVLDHRSRIYKRLK